MTLRIKGTKGMLVGKCQKMSEISLKASNLWRACRNHHPDDSPDQKFRTIRMHACSLVEGITSTVTKLMFRCSLSPVAILNRRVVFSGAKKKLRFRSWVAAVNWVNWAMMSCLLFPHHSVLRNTKTGTGSSSQRHLEVPNSNTGTFNKKVATKACCGSIYGYISSRYMDMP